MPRPPPAAGIRITIATPGARRRFHRDLAAEREDALAHAGQAEVTLGLEARRARSRRRSRALDRPHAASTSPPVARISTCAGALPGVPRHVRERLLQRAKEGDFGLVAEHRQRIGRVERDLHAAPLGEFRHQRPQRGQQAEVVEQRRGGGRWSRCGCRASPRRRARARGRAARAISSSTRSRTTPSCIFTAANTCAVSSCSSSERRRRSSSCWRTMRRERASSSTVRTCRRLARSAFTSSRMPAPTASRKRMSM